tara:strand:- start:4 stop:192 length:189 start_codon:yes stop_codon:yes gene_type:complete
MAARWIKKQKNWLRSHYALQLGVMDALAFTYRRWVGWERRSKSSPINGVNIKAGALKQSMQT